MIGATVGRLWAKAGHKVRFATRRPEQLGNLSYIAISFSQHQHYPGGCALSTPASLIAAAAQSPVTTSMLVIIGESLTG